MAYLTIYTFNDLDKEKILIGPMNKFIELLNMELGVSINHVNNCLVLSDDEESLSKEQLVKAIINLLNDLIIGGIEWQERDLIYIIQCFKDSTCYEQTSQGIMAFYNNKKIIIHTFERKKISPKTINQAIYLEAMQQSSVIFASGSAGSGKTYLAVAYAVGELKRNAVKKIIITRPAVEAGEKLGFLPGDLKEKVDPYLIPIYDSFYEFLGRDATAKLIEKGVIEIAPLAYMRGRTLDNAMIILDEAQNTTSNQMKMFLTRLGFNSTMIVTGDTTQIDLPNRQMSGLVEATKLLQNIPGIAHIKFNRFDVMRHPIVSKIIEKYEEQRHD